MAAASGAGPLGLTAWVAAVSSALNLVVATYRGTMTTLTLRSFLFFLIWAVLGTVIPQTLLFWVAGRMASSTISVIVLLEGFIVFLLAAALRLEAPTFKRFAGLAIGFAAIVPILGDASSLHRASLPLTMIAVIGLPVCYAVENVWISSCKPVKIDPVAGLALMQAIGAGMAFALAFAFGDVFWPTVAFGHLETIIVLLGVCAAIANFLFQSLILSSGSVFTGQCSYLITLSGIGWSMVLLGETVSLWIGFSLVGMFIGILMVAPKKARSAAPRQASSFTEKG
jgi:drug/metabolite transporter (DMT)-like permease